MTTDHLVHIEREGAILILVPQTDLGETRWLEFEAEQQEVRQLLRDASIRYVLVDMQQADYFGSEALTWFLYLREKMVQRGGNVVLCELSAHARDILEITHLDSLLPIYPTRAAALAVLT